MSCQTERALRLFFALWPDPPLRAGLKECLRGLQATARGKWVPPGKFHITLLFLGDIAADRLSAVREVADAVTGSPFELVLDRVEFWPRKGILCLVPGAVPEGLLGLVRDLTAGLTRGGFLLDPRPYRAHLTLARKGSSDWTLRRLEEPLRWKVDGFGLVESRLDREGSRYVILQSWRLGHPEAIPEVLPVR